MRYPFAVIALVLVFLLFLWTFSQMNTGKKEAELKYYCGEVEAGTWADFDGRCPSPKAREAQLKKMT